MSAQPDDGGPVYPCTTMPAQISKIDAIENAIAEFPRNIVVKVSMTIGNGYRCGCCRRTTNETEVFQIESYRDTRESIAEWVRNQLSSDS